MLLDRIEIDSHGPLHRVEIGPLSHHLNVILGPIGSGKTAISRFIRDSLLDRDYPAGMLSQSAGRVVWVDQHGWFHCRREHDGTHAGRHTFQFQPRGESFGQANAYRSGWFSVPAGPESPTLVESLHDPTIAGVQIPDTIVDGILVDTMVSSIGHVVAACLQSGLEQSGLAPLPYENEVSPLAEDAYVSPVDTDAQRQRRSLRRELAEVEAQLAQVERDPVIDDAPDASGPFAKVPFNTSLTQQRNHLIRDREAVIRRRDETLRQIRAGQALHGSIHASNVEDRVSMTLGVESDAPAERLRQLHLQADGLRARAGQLQRWIRELDSRATWRTPSSVSSLYQEHAFRDQDSNQLHQAISVADADLVTLRQSLAEIRELSRWIHRHQGMSFADGGWASGTHGLADRRYSQFVSAIDHYRHDAPWNEFYDSAYKPLHRIDDWHIRLRAAAHQIDTTLRRIESRSRSLDGTNITELGIESIRRLRSELQRAANWTVDAIDWPATSPSLLNECETELESMLDRVAIRRADAMARLRTFHHSVDFGAEPDWVAQRRASVAELRHVELTLQNVLHESARLRRRQRYLPVLDHVYPTDASTTSGRQAFVGELPLSATERSWLADLDIQLHHLNQEIRLLESQIRHERTYVEPLASYPAGRPASASIGSRRWNELSFRRAELIAALQRQVPIGRSESSLREMASGWLVRLTGGRHRILTWETSAANLDAHVELESVATSSRPTETTNGRRVHVQVDGVSERQLDAATRAVGAIAVRLAAGELLSRLGRQIPLVIETSTEMLTHLNAAYRPSQPTHRDAFRHWTSEGVQGGVLAAALSDYAASGHQLVLLTSEDGLADDLTRRGGGRLFHLHQTRLVHPHRPIWRGGRRDDQYVGPHGAESAFNVSYSPDPIHKPLYAENVNRQFDLAWAQSAGLHESVPTFATNPGYATDVPPVGASYRDGYFYAHQTTTAPTSNQYDASFADTEPRATKAAVPAVNDPAPNPPPFFLTVDSPIDGAPSIDAVAASKLRRIGISHITHLMNQDSNRLADTLGLSGVDAPVIRRWQSECRLMCRVPQLRGFDARVLVGCGIRGPEQLADVAPSDLLEQVKTFLATEQGQRILLSGTSYELSRITSWIASANAGVGVRKRRRRVSSDRAETRIVDGRRVRRRVLDQDSSDDIRDFNDLSQIDDAIELASNPDAWEFDDDSRYEIRSSDDDQTKRVKRSSTGTTRRSSRSTGTPRGSRGSRSSVRSRSNGGSRRSRSTSSSHYEDNGRRSRRDDANDRRRSRRESSVESYSASTTSTQDASTWRFYLQRSDAVVEAPSIGPRMAGRLNRIGIASVDDLLRASAATVASQLNHRRIDASIVRAWQQQATLVCRIPMLRGHDAQFLVAADVTTAEAVAASQPARLFAAVDAVANSSEGRRIARGGRQPDLAEVTDWIRFAAEHRTLQAA
ncbi:MAG: DUF4332 domain-containing protein [Planctomycetota bacterium]